MPVSKKRKETKTTKTSYPVTVPVQQNKLSKHAKDQNLNKNRKKSGPFTFSYHSEKQNKDLGLFARPDCGRCVF